MGFVFIAHTQLSSSDCAQGFLSGNPSGAAGFTVPARSLGVNWRPSSKSDLSQKTETNLGENEQGGG